jgi:hypothetical protein
VGEKSGDEPGDEDDEGAFHGDGCELSESTDSIGSNNGAMR